MLQNAGTIVVIGLGALVALLIAVYLWRIRARWRTGSASRDLATWRELQLDYLNLLTHNPDPKVLRHFQQQYGYPTAQVERVLRESERLYRATDLTRRLTQLEAKAALPSPTKKLEQVIEEKKSKFLSIPSISFHYANEQQIRSFYEDYFKEPTVASLVAEIAGEIEGDVKASIPQILESHIGTKDLSKWVSTIKLPETSLGGMFLRYQRETIRSGQVSLGLEEVDIELTELEAFDEALSELDRRFDLRLDPALVENHRSHLKARAAERTLLKLEQASGWALIEGRFRIEAEDGYYRCVHMHPVTDYLPAGTGPVAITVLLREDAIEAHVSGNYRQSIGKLVPIRVYGQVWQPIDRANNVWELQVTPLAVY